jgi:hypothetical protein
MRPIAVDYETFFIKSKPTDPGYSVAKQGNWRYSHDERFDPYLMSVFDGSNSWVGNPRDFNWAALEDAPLIAHNAGFDRAITHRLVELGIAPTRMLRNEWQCTANLTSYIGNVRSLADAMFFIEGESIDKSARDEMTGKHWSDLDAAGQERMAKYAITDVRKCRGLWDKHSPNWPTFEQNLSRLTINQCSRGVAINTELLDQYRAVLGEVIFNLERSLPWTERGAKPTSPKAIAEQCRMENIPCPPFKTKDEEGFNEWESTYGKTHAWVLAVGQWRSLGKLLSTLDTIKERLRPDGTIDFSLLYFGAHTGRWSGGGSGLNLQNLRKLPLYLKNRCVINVPATLRAGTRNFKDWVNACTDYALDVRKLFIPRAGRKFILSDLSQIEPRVLAWLTGNTQLMDLMKSGMAIYEAFARVSMGWRGGKLKDENPDLYQLAKIQVLGLGYGCGDEKFIEIAAGYDVPLTEEESQKLVTDFRQQNPRIAGEDGIWRRLDDGFRASVGGDFEMALPSGRSMNYRGVLREVRMKRDKKTKKMSPRFVYTAQIGDRRKELYGGLLTENLVQATARDVFGTHLLSLEGGVGDVVWSIHDEAVMEVDNDVTTRDVEHVMSVCPDWLEGCPVGAEAKEAPHYLK